MCPQKVPMDTQKAVLTSPRKTFRKKDEKVSLKIPNWWRRNSFLTEQLWYFNMFLWLHTLRFWQSGWVFSDWRGFISTQCSSIIKTIMFLGITACDWFVPRDIYIAFFNNTAGNFSKQSSRSFICCLELMKKFYLKLISLCSKFSIGHAEGSFGITAKIFWRKTEFSCTVQTGKAYMYFQLVSLASKCSYGQVEGSFDNPW